MKVEIEKKIGIAEQIEVKNNNLVKQIIEWGKEKGINNPTNQFNKLAEEKLEAYEAYKTKDLMFYFGKKEEFAAADFHLKEELGDIGVVWILLCNMLGVDPYEALEIAHNKNKDRKGKTINGNFIKEEDLGGKD